jgi:hypothetical protein
LLKIKDTTSHTFFVSTDVEYNLIAFMQFAGNILVKKGFKVYNLDKGILDWKELGKEISF